MLVKDGNVVIQTLISQAPIIAILANIYKVHVNLFHARWRFSFE